MNPTHRIALYLDVENLIHARRVAGDWAGAARDLLSLIHALSARGTIVGKIACCDEDAARHLAPALAAVGVRTFIHAGGPDAADLMLMEHVSCAPRSCDTVVIASGDHIFASIAETLRTQGKHLAAAAVPGSISADLYLAVDEFIPVRDDDMLAVHDDL